MPYKVWRKRRTRSCSASMGGWITTSKREETLSPRIPVKVCPLVASVRCGEHTASQLQSHHGRKMSVQLTSRVSTTATQGLLLLLLFRILFYLFCNTQFLWVLPFPLLKSPANRLSSSLCRSHIHCR